MDKQTKNIIQFIENWLNSEKENAAKNLSKITDSKAKASCELLLKRFTLKTPEEQSDYFKDLIKIIDRPSKLDINIYCLLLCFATDHAYLLNKLTDLQRISQLLQNIDLSKVCSACKGTFYSAKARKILSDKGVGHELSKASYKVMQHFKTGTLAWYKKMVYWLYNISNYKEISNPVSIINSLKKYSKLKYSTHPPEYLLSLYYRANMEFDNALQELNKITDLPKFHTLAQTEVFSDKILLLYLNNEIPRGDAELKKYLKINPDFTSDELYFIMLSKRDLIKKDYTQAQVYIKEIMNKENQFQFFIVMATELFLESELAQKKNYSARRILKNIDPDQSDTSLFQYWVRLYLLEGDFEKAFYFFKTLRSNSLNVLSHFNLSHEISTPDMIRLLTSSELTVPSKVLNDNQKEKSHALPNAQGIDKSIIGETEEIIIVKKNIVLYAKQNTPVLITGDTGTGKEDTARLLHQLSDKAKEPFMPVNCGAISETLMEAELFGYKKGAFTGALNDRKGLFESAGSGTVFLDEISSMPMKLQASLLRVLENMQIRPLGSTKYIPIKAKIIAATNVRLEKLVEEKSFRLDLYFRLNRLQINLPPLCERKEDIPLLTQHFINLYFDDPEVKLDQKLIEIMIKHQWPGNIRELKNEIERMAIIAGNNKILTNELVQFSKNDLASQNKSTPTPSLMIQEKSKDTLDSNHTINQFKQEDSSSLKNKGFGARKYSDERREHLKRLFQQHKHLTRSMAMRLLGCATNTVANDLKILAATGFITKITPTNSPRSSYFILTEESIK